ncbi:hypothetical protein VDGD_21020 [Verticillium dahliae]|nr:hypothetical protein VDGD_21020 [Verticillium dahliae]
MITSHVVGSRPTFLPPRSLPAMSTFSRAIAPSASNALNSTMGRFILHRHESGDPPIRPLSPL